MSILSIFPFFQGINELHIVFLFDFILLLVLFYKVHKNKKFIFTKDIKFIMILGWSISYLITCFYSPDTELAFFGFLKYFTVPLFILLVMQYEYTEEEKNKWFDWIAKIGSIMVGIILMVTIIEKFMGVEEYKFFYQNRLAGFFSYANSFGLFLLIGFIVVGFKKEIKILDFVISNLLLIGIILTNSRAIMIITVFSYLLLLIFNKESRKKNFINLGFLISITIAITFLMSKVGVNNRLAGTTAGSGEFLLRLLYYKDALRMIAKNIFGYGYMAWWYMQEGMQTGAYDAQFVHNGLLQVALDAGVISAILIVFVYIKGFFEKKTLPRDRIIMLVILGHSLIDFNIEFLAITLVLFMTLNFDKKVEVKNTLFVNIGIIGLGIIYMFFGYVCVLNKLGKYANDIFSYSIALNDELGTNIDVKRQLEIGEELYIKNKYFLNASSILSQKEQYLDNYEKANEYEEWIIRNKKYTMANYIQYIQFLERAIKYYYGINDYENAKKYIAKLKEVPNIIDNVKNTSDSLAYKIQHKPRLDIPIEITEFINQMKIFEESLY